MFPADITVADVFRELSSEHLWQVAGVLVGAWGVAKAVRWSIRRVAERAPARVRRHRGVPGAGVPLVVRAHGGQYGLRVSPGEG